MGGFLPLLEAFAAFALTMVALTTAVSTILGVLQRIVRFRSAGMRRQLIFFFRNSLKTLLYPPTEPTSAQKWEEMNAELKQFLVDVSFQPSPNPPDPNSKEDPRLGSAILPERIPGDVLVRMAHWWKLWRSLKLSVDTLPPDEFVTRLKTSHVYAARIAPLGPEVAETRVADLKARFIADGQAATDRFARSCRTATVIIGFVLAFGFNVDAFMILGRYLTDPKLTADVLQQQAEIINKAQTTEVTVQKTGANADEAKLDAAAKALQEAADAVKQAGTNAVNSQFEEIQKRAKAVHEAAQVVGENMKDASEAVTMAAQSANALRATLSDLSAAFPIGWTLYPACTSQSTDARCITAFRGAKMALKDGLHGLWWIFCNDPAGFWRWFLGALTMGLMLGLGTPFWIEVVNNFLRARDLITNNRKEKPKNEAAAPTPPPAPPANPAAPPPTPPQNPANPAPPAPPAPSGGRSVF
jgi:hypothetical protein